MLNTFFCKILMISAVAFPISAFAALDQVPVNKTLSPQKTTHLTSAKKKDAPAAVSYVKPSNFNKKTIKLGMFASLLQQAKDGDAEAQYKLGNLYAQGRDVKRDRAQAFSWYEKSALKGDLKAQAMLGFYYDKGLGVKKDYQKSLYWYHKGALADDSDAQYGMGALYYQGHGVPVNREKTVEWYTKSALQGNKYAQSSLGFLYLTGDGIDVDETKGVYWLKKAAAQGDVDSKIALEKL